MSALPNLGTVTLPLRIPGWIRAGSEILAGALAIYLAARYGYELDGAMAVLAAIGVCLIAAGLAAAAVPNAAQVAIDLANFLTWLGEKSHPSSTPIQPPAPGGDSSGGPSPRPPGS